MEAVFLKTSTPIQAKTENNANTINKTCNDDYVARWSSGLRRWIKVPIRPRAWVQTPLWSTFLRLETLQFRPWRSSPAPTSRSQRCLSDASPLCPAPAETTWARRRIACVIPIRLGGLGIFLGAGWSSGWGVRFLNGGSLVGKRRPE